MRRSFCAVLNYPILKIWDCDTKNDSHHSDRDHQFNKREATCPHHDVRVIAGNW
jgi:hypothetical protein